MTKPFRHEVYDAWPKKDPKKKSYWWVYAVVGLLVAALFNACVQNVTYRDVYQGVEEQKVDPSYVYVEKTYEPKPEVVPTPEPKLLPPCATEDSENCYWDADTMGNGEGHDVVN